jgi:hypothetical protein
VLIEYADFAKTDPHGAGAAIGQAHFSRQFHEPYAVGHKNRQPDRLFKRKIPEVENDRFRQSQRQQTQFA